MTIIHNKLVRDRIPQIIADSGKSCVTRTLTEKDYIAALDVKLSEELAEYLRETDPRKRLEELADLMEVMMAAASAAGASIAQVEAIRRDKAEKRGSFDRRIFLESVTD